MAYYFGMTIGVVGYMWIPNHETLNH